MLKGTLPQDEGHIWFSYKYHLHKSLDFMILDNKIFKSGDGGKEIGWNRVNINTPVQNALCIGCVFSQMGTSAEGYWSFSIGWRRDQPAITIKKMAGFYWVLGSRELKSENFQWPGIWFQNMFLIMIDLDCRVITVNYPRGSWSSI